MHELYQHSTLAALAGRLDALAAEAAVAGAGAAREAVPERAPEWRRWACGLAQLAALPILIGVRMLIWLTPFFTYHYFTGDEGDSVWLAVTLSISSYLACNLLSFGVAVAGKWGILGSRPAAIRCMAGCSIAGGWSTASWTSRRRTCWPARRCRPGTCARWARGSGRTPPSAASRCGLRTCCPWATAPALARR